jgi:subtilisin family serine protease
VAIPSRIFAQASPISLGGRSIFERPHELRSVAVSAFASLPNVTSAATQRLVEAGFEILQVTPFTINFAGAPDVFERAFRTKIVEREVAQLQGTSTFLDSPDTEILGLISTQGTPLANVIEGVALEVPRRFLSAAAGAPPVDYWHLDVPADVALGCNATLLHRLQITGRGVNIAMVDSGWFRHPFFAAHGYAAAPIVLGPAASAPDADESGHGTGESANILAIAPDCILHPVKANFVNTIGAFNAAVALQPDIITCSWGSHTPTELSAADMALAASVSAAVAAGITVIFSAGNGHAGFPGQHPDVISAGGVFMGPDGNLIASNYASGFQSLIYPGRRVPDVCGLVGLRPKAIYIMLPVEPGDSIDTENAGSVFPDGDQTTADDGWAAFSGTSAAAPQLAGVAALIKQAVPSATPGDIKAALSGSARDVVAGMCSPVPPLHNGLPAAPGVDDATGAGLVDATGAVWSAYNMSLMGITGLPPATDSIAAAYYGGVLNVLATVNPLIAAYLQGIGAAAMLASQQPRGG